MKLASHFFGKMNVTTISFLSISGFSNFLIYEMQSLFYD